MIACLEFPYPSLGPVIVHTTEVLPITTRLLPSLAGCVEMDAENLRSSFQRRPSCRRRVEEYVDDVSKGIDACLSYGVRSMITKPIQYCRTIFEIEQTRVTRPRHAWTRSFHVSSISVMTCRRMISRSACAIDGTSYDSCSSTTIYTIWRI